MTPDQKSEYGLWYDRMYDFLHVQPGESVYYTVSEQPRSGYFREGARLALEDIHRFANEYSGLYGHRWTWRGKLDLSMYSIGYMYVVGCYNQKASTCDLPLVPIKDL